MSRLGRAALALAVITVGLTGVDAYRDTTPAAAWSDGVCTTRDGVTVVVDFQELGGGVHVRCAPQPVATGLEALQRAGIDHQTTVRFPGFLCRIAGKPANDPCQTASPATAYWSYWLAPRGGQWCYSNWGAGNRRPPPGSVEGWSFSLNRSGSTAPPPRFAVPAPLPGTAPGSLPTTDCDGAAAVPAPPPTTRPPRTTLAPRPSSTSPGGPAAPAAPAAPAGAPGAGAAPGTPATGSPPLPGPSPTAPAGVEVDATGEDPEDPIHDSAGSDGNVGGGTGGSDPEVAGRSETAPASSTTSEQPERALGQESAVDLGGGSRSSSPIGLVATGALVAALVGGSLVTRRRRGGQDQP